MRAICSTSAAGCRVPTAPKTVRSTVVKHIVPFKAATQQKRADAQRVGFFKFGKNGYGAEDAGIVGSQNKEDFDLDDLEQYFNYMGCLAEEGTYDRMYALSDSGLCPIDAILVLAAENNDTPKIQEILNAGANPFAKDPKGRTPIELATKPEVKALLQQFMDKAGKAAKA